MFVSVNRFVDTIKPSVQNLKKIFVLFKPDLKTNKFDQVTVKVFGAIVQTDKTNLCFDYNKIGSIFSSDEVFLNFKPVGKKAFSEGKEYETLEIDPKPRKLEMEGTEFNQTFYSSRVVELSGKSVQAILNRAAEQMQKANVPPSIDEFEFV